MTTDQKAGFDFALAEFKENGGHVQCLLFGPSATGKTYLANALEAHFTKHHPTTIVVRQFDDTFMEHAPTQKGVYLYESGATSYGGIIGKSPFKPIMIYLHKQIESMKRTAKDDAVLKADLPQQMAELTIAEPKKTDT